MFRAQLILPLMLLSLLFSSGCKTSQVVSQSKPEGSAGGIKPGYNDLVLNYETTDLRRLFSRIKTGSVANSLASHFSFGEESISKEPLKSADQVGKWSQARIQIVYPHPDGSEDKGLARLVVSRHSPIKPVSHQSSINLKDRLSRLMLRASGASPEFAQQIGHKEGESQTVDEEVWQLDLPKEELDILLSELSERGFFNQQERPRGEATVSILVDQGKLSKRWTSEPRLEDLMQQVYDEGKLSAFNTHGTKTLTVSLARIKST